MYNNKIEFEGVVISGLTEEKNKVIKFLVYNPDYKVTIQVTTFQQHYRYIKSNLSTGDSKMRPGSTVKIVGSYAHPVYIDEEQQKKIEDNINKLLAKQGKKYKPTPGKKHWEVGTPNIRTNTIQIIFKPEERGMFYETNKD